MEVEHAPLSQIPSPMDIDGSEVQPSYPAWAQLQAAFPAAPLLGSPLLKATGPQGTGRVLRSSTGKRSRLQYSASGFTRSPSCEEQQGSRQGGDSTAALTSKEAADILVSFKRRRTDMWQAQQESAQQSAQQAAQHSAQDVAQHAAQQAALQVPQQAAQQAAKQAMQHPAQHKEAGLSAPNIADIAAIAAAATAMLATSGHPPELLVEACCQLATHYFALDAAQVAAEALSMLADQPPLQPVAQHTRAPTKKHTAAQQAASSAAGMASPFAAMSCKPRQASADSTAMNNSAGEGTDAAKVWTEAHLAKLAPLKIQPSAVTSAVLPVHSPKAAAQAWTTSPGSSARSTASPLQPGLLDQCFSGGVAAWASGSQAASPEFRAPLQERLHTYVDDKSVFARQISSQITPETQAAIKASWAARGRVAVSCGMVGQKGLAGIFVVDSTGSPKVWVPKSRAAAAQLDALVAAGGGSSQVPAGYESIDPKTFEERAGKIKTRNWQLSCQLKDFAMATTPKGSSPSVKLGHLVRIVGIPTAARS